MEKYRPFRDDETICFGTPSKERIDDAIEHLTYPQFQETLKLDGRCDLPGSQAHTFRLLYGRGMSFEWSMQEAKKRPGRFAFPAIKTDSIFNEGKFSGDAARCHPEEVWLRQQAETAGVSTTGKWYCRGLADFPGDPTAWVASRGDVLEVAKAKGMKVSGYVEYTPPEMEPHETGLAVAPDIVDELADQMMAERGPGADPGEVWDDAYRIRAGLVDHNPLVVSDNCLTLEEINSGV